MKPHDGPAEDNLDGLEGIETTGQSAMWLTAAGNVRVMFQTTTGDSLIFEWDPIEAVRMAQLILMALNVAPIGEREFQMNPN